jgi:hypothetical protein
VNRSILIVICDFIVLSVMSLSTGVAPINQPHSGGTVIDGNTARVVIEELNKKKIALEVAKRELQSQKGSISGEQIKNVSNDIIAIQKKINELKDKKIQPEPAAITPQLKSELENVINTLASQHNGQLTEKELALLGKRLLSIKEDLKNKNEQLANTSDELLQAKKRLQELENNVAQSNVELKKSKELLTQTQQKLHTASGDLLVAQGQAAEAKLERAYVSGRLDETSKQLAEFKSKIEKSNRTASQSALELAANQKQIDNFKALYNRAVNEISNSRNELDVLRKEQLDIREKLDEKQQALSDAKVALQSAQTTLDETKIRLKDAEDRLRSDALQRYSAAAVKLNFAIKEKRFMSDYTANESFYLPELIIGKKSYLAINFNIITGLFKDISGYSKVYSLGYSIGEPLDSDNSTLKTISNPIISLNYDNRACLIEVPTTRKGMKPITFSQLKTRGIQNLFLFKSNSFGKRTCSLEGRASLNLAGDDSCLYIRNSTRRTDGEVKAEAGDFVVTKEGDFVGLIVAVDDFDMGRKQEARCFVFPDDFKLNDVMTIPVTKPDNQLFYQDFMQAVTRVSAKINTQKNH